MTTPAEAVRGNAPEDGSRKTALITGASMGIGRELAILAAGDRCDLILVARSKDKLAELGDELSQRHQVSIRVVAMDLSEASAPRSLYDLIAQSGTTVDILVNNAGFGAYGRFDELPYDTLREMIQLNVISLAHLCHLFLPAMIRQGYGRVMNVASTAAFQPGPLMAIYYASKAFVLSFTEALTEELRGTGVSLTALCPGPTTTGFQTRAGNQKSGLARIGMMEAGPVASAGYRGMMAGRAVVVTGFTNKLLAQSLRISPRFLTRRIVKKLQEPSR